MHNNQFVAIAKSAIIHQSLTDLENFMKVGFNDWDFFYNADSEIHTGVNKYGIEFLIFGICENLKGNDEVDLAIENCKTEAELLSHSYFFSGRFFIFFDGCFYPDASGHLQLFYNSSFNMVSSSLGLLKSLLGNSICPFRYREFKKLGFFPAPYTIYVDIQLLLSNQKIADKKVQYIEKTIISLNSEISKTEFLLTTSIFLSKLNKKYELILPLTGGIDSRTILAFLLKLKFQFFSYTSLYKGILGHDIIIPRLLSFFYRFKYKCFLDNKKNELSERKKRLSNFKFHTGSNVIDKDKTFYTHGLYPNLKKASKKKVMLRGAGWAVFRGFYTKDLKSGSDNYERISSLKLLFKDLQDCPLALNALQLWFEGSSFFPYDWRVQFYIDQRINAWDGPLEQSISLANFEPTLIINSDYQIGLLYSWFKKEFDNVEGRSRILQRKIINDLKPSLNIFPYNFSKLKLFKKTKLKITHFFNK